MVSYSIIRYTVHLFRDYFFSHIKTIIYQRKIPYILDFKLYFFSLYKALLLNEINIV